VIEVKTKKKLGNFLLDVYLKDENFICLTGKNGSGKTSFLNLLAGVYKPDEGYVKIDSKNITEVPMEERRVILVTPDSCIPHLDVDKHLIWGAKIRKANVPEEVLQNVKKSFGINYSGKVSKLSLGMRERVSLTTALLSSPDLILVDEAFSNLDNRTDFIREYKDFSLSKDIDVIFATQQSEDSSQVDHLYRMENGHCERVF
jgi:molybdate/tungstate transport system ATP-binding protein